MKGLIYKECLTYYRASRAYSRFITIALYLALLFYFRNFYIFSLIVLLAIPIGCGGLPTTLRDQDDKVNGMQFTLALPYRKKDIVIGRYLFMFIFIAKEMLIGLVITLLYFTLFGNVSLSDHILVWICGFGIALLFGSLNMLGSFFLNLNGVVIMYLVSLILGIVMYLLPTILGIDLAAFLMHAEYLYILLPILLLLCMIGCIWGSIKMMERNQA